jgi:hypothetical protein
LIVSNISSKEQILEITVDQCSQSYSCDEIFGPYMREELPFEYRDGSEIPNSELSMHSWFIEAPVSKDLKKSVTIRMSPMCEKEMIIVMKAPLDRMASNLATFLNIRLLEDR